jgi:tRNA threonylcarbamoyladenosine biosynthesis protein TsaE
MTVLDLRECALSWDSASAEETERMGEALGRLLQPGDVVALFGELGSGKTVLVRGIAAGFGCVRSDVHSPSFTLVNEYACHGAGGAAVTGGGDLPARDLSACGAPAGAQAGRRMAHVDLYRIRSEEELPGIGWDAYVHSRHVVAVEWAERALRWLPDDCLRVSLEMLAPERRRFRVQATGPRSVRIALGWVETGGFAARGS